MRSPESRKLELRWRVHERNRALDVASVKGRNELQDSPRSPATSPTPEPGGLEGLLGVQVLGNPNRLAVLESATQPAGDRPPRHLPCLAGSARPRATIRPPRSRISETSGLNQSRAPYRSRSASRTPACPQNTLVSPPSITWNRGRNSTSGSSHPPGALRHRDGSASNPRLRVSTFSCDIAHAVSRQVPLPMQSATTPPPFRPKRYFWTTMQPGGFEGPILGRGPRSRTGRRTPPAGAYLCTRLLE